MSRRRRFALTPAQSAHVNKIADQLGPDKGWDFLLRVGAKLQLSQTGPFSDAVLQQAIDNILADLVPHG